MKKQAEYEKTTVEVGEKVGALYLPLPDQSRLHAWRLAAHLATKYNHLQFINILLSIIAAARLADM